MRLTLRVIGLSMLGTLAFQVHASPTALCSKLNLSACLDGVSTSATSGDTLRLTASRLIEFSRSETQEEAGHEGLTSSHANAARAGHAAGDLFTNIGVWGSYNRSNFDSDALVTPYDGNLDSFLIGVDSMPIRNLVVGLGFGYENTDTSTLFNGGGQNTDGFTVAPYIAWFLNDIFSVDLSGGYSRLNTDQDRLDPANGNTLGSSFDSDRRFVTTNLNASIVRGSWVLGGRVGYLYSEEEQDAYTEAGGPSAKVVKGRHLDLGQGYIGVDLAYSFGALEPYATVTYYNDFTRDNGTGGGPGGGPGPGPGPAASQAMDDDEVQAGFGVRYFGSNGISGTLEWLKTAGRERFDNNSLTATLRIDL